MSVDPPAVLFDGAGWSARVAASRPADALCVRDGAAWRREGAGLWRRTGEAPLDALRSLAREPRAGVALLASYDAGRLIERVPEIAEDDTRLPQVVALRFDSDPAPGPAPDPAPGPMSFGPIRARSSPKQFEDMVLRAKERVRAGDVFQVNLSHRLEAATDARPIDVYARLREANPAPFSAFFATGPLPDDPEGFHVLSSSPELLFRLRGAQLQAKPIAGTRPRGATPAEDDALRAELLADPKERAEHVMLVDLARNDLGRVARFGSVRVPDLLTVESYRTVHHLVSRVVADLADGKDAVDALVALFPGGTITGAPKVRAMEIIESLEPVRRGVYTGSLGWIAPDGSCEFNILIRTLMMRRGQVHLQVGAGIVEDSVPHREHEETLAKAKGLLLALGK